MISIINRIARHRVTQNATALMILQAATIAAPLLVLPYLTRVLNIETFGLLMVIFSLFSIGIIITDFGFSLYATYKIAEHREDKKYVSSLIGAVFCIKVLFCFLMLTLLIVFHGFITNNSILVLYISLNLVIQAFFPTWFFQGIEKMRNITLYTILGKVVYIILVLTFVGDSNDMPLVVLFIALSNALSVIVGWYYMYKNGYAIKLPTPKYLKLVLLESSSFFFARAAVSLYTAASTFIVGSISGAGQAALFGAAEKVYQASQAVTSSFSQAFFPFIAKTKKTNSFIKAVCFCCIILSFFCSVFGVFSDELMEFVFGGEFAESGSVLSVFMLITVVNFISVNFGYPVFSSLDKLNIVNKTVYIGGLLQVVLLLVLTWLGEINALNVVLSVLVTEAVVMFMRVSIYYIISGKILKS